MQQWLIELEQEAFFSGELGYVETCTYWGPTLDPDADDGNPDVSASIKRTSREADYDNGTGSTGYSATAVLNRADVELSVDEPNDYGVLEDENGVRWNITEVTGENDALWKVNLESRNARHYGGIRTRE